MRGNICPKYRKVLVKYKLIILGTDLLYHGGRTIKPDFLRHIVGLVECIVQTFKQSMPITGKKFDIFLEGKDRHVKVYKTDRPRCVC